MRDLAFIAALGAMLPVALARPFVGILLWSWISFLNPHQLTYGFPRTMPWAMIVFVTTVIGCLVAREPKRLPINPITVMLLLLMGCFTLTSLTALGPADTMWAKWDRTIKVLIGLLLTAAMLTDMRRIHALIWMMVLSLGFYGARGGFFTLVTAGSYRVYGPAETMIADNNHLGAGLLVMLPLMNYLRLHSAHRLVRVGLACAMALTLLSVVGTYSRGALIGLGAMVVMAWWRGRNRIKNGVLLAVGLAAAIGFMPDRWTERMNTIGTYQEDASASTRLVLWNISFRLALSRPLVGTGFMGPYTQSVVDRVEPGGPARAVHSIWFELLAEHGFPTFFIWVGLSVAGLVTAQRMQALSRGRPELLWAGDLGRMAKASIVAYLVSGTFLSLSYWDFYWTLLVVLAAAYAQARGVSVPTVTHSADVTRWRQPAPA